MRRHLKYVLASTPLHSALIEPHRRRTKRATLFKPVVISTHHKTGTAWLGKIFRALCCYHKIPYSYYKKTSLTNEVVFDQHSRAQAQPDNFRGVHLIRNPKEMICSGLNYHRVTKETWAHIKQKKYGGKSYQEFLNSVSIEDGIFAEIERSSSAVKAMHDWDYTDPRYIEVKYEDLMSDHDLKIFFSIFSHLHMPGETLGTALELSWYGSIFGGRIKKTDHITSGRLSVHGQYFSEEHHSFFHELYGSVCADLGYSETE